MSAQSGTTLRFGIIGTGGMGSAHAREIAAREDAEVVAACDINQAAIDRFLERVPALKQRDIARFTDVAALAGSGLCDAVIIATPHTQHDEHIRLCLDAGLHVLCEKPMATTAAGARASIAAAERNGKVLAIAYQRHGTPLYRRAHEVVQSGEIGDIRLVTVLIAQDCLDIFSDPTRTWRADPTMSGGGHFMDTGSHINDMMLYVSGLAPEQVFANFDNYGTLVDVITALSIRFTNGACGTFAATSLSHEPWREEFSFYGSEGVLNIRDGKVTLHKKGQDTRILRGSGRESRPVANFIQAIKGEIPEPQAGPVYGLRVAQITEAAYKSARSGQPERVG
jgi:predicted dehydrogenase